MVGKGPGATSISLDLEPFTLIGATTRSGLLPNPLRDRFGFTANLEFYSPDELAEVLARSARHLEIDIDSDAASLVASRSRGTPRIANRLLRRIRDYALVHEIQVVDLATVGTALAVYEVDAAGLDRLDRHVLSVLARNFAGKPVGLTTIAAAVGEEVDTIESVVEPFLVRSGLIQRTPRGRQITSAGLQHLDIEGSF